MLRAFCACAGDDISGSAITSAAAARKVKRVNFNRGVIGSHPRSAHIRTRRYGG